VDPAERVANVFQTQALSSPHLDVLVEIPASSKWQDTIGHCDSTNLIPAPQDESSFKRRRLADHPNSSSLEGNLSLVSDAAVLVKMQQFWKSLWHDKVDLFREVSVCRDPNPIEGVDVPATMKVLHLPGTFDSISDVMIRGDYDEAVRDIERHRTSETPPKNVIIAGHPGIGRTMGSNGQAWIVIYTPPYLGKTTLLYYILVKRLLEQKPTILQTNSHVLFFFNANGVQVLHPSWFVDHKSEAYQNAWALVDINADIQTPAAILRESALFLVIASFPRASQWKGMQRCREPTAFWFMKPFTLGELIQA